MMNQNQKNQSGNFLRVIPLGGAGGVNQNMFVYETAQDIVVVDCGIDFPEIEADNDKFGIPDINYLQKNFNKIKGIIITHGHEDHYGALRFILPKGLNKVPVFAPRIACEFIKTRLKEGGVSAILNVFSGKGEIRLGGLRIFPFQVNHSVPDTMGLCFETPAGKIFHVADFKFDLTPVNGKVFDFQRAVNLAQGKVLALFSDCLGANEEGFTKTEREIEGVFEQILSKANSQVFITTLSSNIARIQEVINASLKFGRKVCILGRSIEQSVEIARSFNYLKVSNKDLIFQGKSKKIPPNKITYLVAGSYGQSNSSLVKIAQGKYHGIKLLKDAAVVFSADPAPPGAKDRVDKLVDELILLGAKVYYYEIQENLHVSGHGSQEDLKLLLALIKPKFAIPIGGNPRHQRAYGFLAQKMGIPSENIFELMNGEILEFRSNHANIVGKVKLKDVFAERS